MTVSLEGEKVAASQFVDLFKGLVKRLSEVVNLMDRVKSWNYNVPLRPVKLSIQMAVNCLENGLESLDENESDEYRKISFFIEQIKLVSKHKFGRHYSPQLTIMSFRISAASSAAYEALLNENVVCLPSLTTLQKVTRRLDSSTGLDNSSYLNLRVSKLNKFDRNIVLIVDDIYIAKRVEYSAGEVQGLTPDGSIANTLLCFTVKSLTSKYKDIVVMYPMFKLTAAKQNDCYQQVAALVRNVKLNVVAIFSRQRHCQQYIFCGLSLWWIIAVTLY